MLREAEREGEIPPRGYSCQRPLPHGEAERITEGHDEDGVGWRHVFSQEPYPIVDHGRYLPGRPVRGLIQARPRDPEVAQAGGNELLAVPDGRAGVRSGDAHADGALRRGWHDGD